MLFTLCDVTLLVLNYSLLLMLEYIQQLHVLVHNCNVYRIYTILHMHVYLMGMSYITMYTMSYWLLTLHSWFAHIFTLTLLHCLYISYYKLHPPYIKNAVSSIQCLLWAAHGLVPWHQLRGVVASSLNLLSLQLVVTWPYTIIITIFIMVLRMLIVWKIRFSPYTFLLWLYCSHRGH